jgi:hypothetical protein
MFSIFGGNHHHSLESEYSKFLDYSKQSNQQSWYVSMLPDKKTDYPNHIVKLTIYKCFKDFEQELNQIEDAAKSGKFDITLEFETREKFDTFQRFIVSIDTESKFLFQHSPAGFNGFKTKLSWG